jgi:transcriptional regulator GlxA family with amidase domain
MVYPYRAASKSQRLSLRERVGVRNDRVLRALAEMEARLEEPADREELARLAGLSLRQLERLFSAHLGETIGECYLRIRLEKAAELLRNTGMTITAVSVACGFQNGSHFSHAFKACFGKPPSAERPGSPWPRRVGCYRHCFSSSVQLLPGRRPGFKKALTTLASRCAAELLNPFAGSAWP